MLSWLSGAKNVSNIGNRFFSQCLQIMKASFPWIFFDKISQYSKFTKMPYFINYVLFRVSILYTFSAICITIQILDLWDNRLDSQCIGSHLYLLKILKYTTRSFIYNYELQKHLRYKSVLRIFFHSFLFFNPIIM